MEKVIFKKKVLHDKGRILEYIPLLSAGSLRREAEDILQEGFVKIFLNINHFKGEGSLMAWMRRIMINTAITHYHKMRKHRYHDDIEEVRETGLESHSWGEADFTKEELWKVIQRMPEGYRMVFNLYAIEGFTHQEIGEELGISVGTSKSNLSRARAILQDKIRNIYGSVIVR